MSEKEEERVHNHSHKYTYHSDFELESLVLCPHTPLSLISLKKKKIHPPQPDPLYLRHRLTVTASVTLAQPRETKHQHKHNHKTLKIFHFSLFSLFTLSFVFYLLFLPLFNGVFFFSSSIHGFFLAPTSPLHDHASIRFWLFPFVPSRNSFVSLQSPISVPNLDPFESTSSGSLFFPNFTFFFFCV